MNLIYYQKFLRYKKIEDILYVHSPVRKKWLCCTQEEVVRQALIYYLIKIKHYPLSLIAEEKTCKVMSLQRRFDVVVFYANSNAFMLVEVKGPQDPLTIDSLLQALQYQTAIEASYVCILNGQQHYLFPTGQAGSEAIEAGATMPYLNREIPSYPF